MLEDKEFGEFLHWLIAEGKNTEINGKTWVELDIDRSTRDSGTVHGKLDYLTALINQYFTEIKKVAFSFNHLKPIFVSFLY